LFLTLKMTISPVLDLKGLKYIRDLNSGI